MTRGDSVQKIVRGTLGRGECVCAIAEPGALVASLRARLAKSYFLRVSSMSDQWLAARLASDIRAHNSYNFSWVYRRLIVRHCAIPGSVYGLIEYTKWPQVFGANIALCGNDERVAEHAELS